MIEDVFNWICCKASHPAKLYIIRWEDPQPQQKPIPKTSSKSVVAPATESVARHEQEKKSSRRRSPSSSRSRSPPRYDLTRRWLKLWIWDWFYTWMLGDEEVVFIQKLNETKWYNYDLFNMFYLDGEGFELDVDMRCSCSACIYASPFIRTYA